MKTSTSDYVRGGERVKLPASPLDLLPSSSWVKRNAPPTNRSRQLDRARGRVNCTGQEEQRQRVCRPAASVPTESCASLWDLSFFLS
jgi:hypothetical protein